MKNKALVLFALSALLLSGCMGKRILTEGSSANPVFEVQEGIVLDWSQIGSDMDAEFENNEEYPEALSVNYMVDQEGKSIDLTLIVKQGATPEAAVAFANAAVRYLNDEAALQDFSYEMSGESSYGGFFKEYDLKLIVLPDSTMERQEFWLVDMQIPKGSDTPITAKEGAVVMEVQEEGEAEEEETKNTLNQQLESQEAGMELGAGTLRGENG